MHSSAALSAHLTDVWLERPPPPQQLAEHPGEMCVSGGVQTFAELSHLFETLSLWYSNPLSPAWNYPKFSSISTILNLETESFLCQSMHGTLTCWFSLWVQCTGVVQGPGWKLKRKVKSPWAVVQHPPGTQCLLYQEMMLEICFLKGCISVLC